MRRINAVSVTFYGGVFYYKDFDRLGTADAVQGCIGRVEEGKY